MQLVPEARERVGVAQAHGDCALWALPFDAVVEEALDFLGCAALRGTRECADADRYCGRPPQLPKVIMVDAAHQR
jgi:hypothetical protein